MSKLEEFQHHIDDVTLNKQGSQALNFEELQTATNNLKTFFQGELHKLKKGIANYEDRSLFNANLEQKLKIVFDDLLYGDSVFGLNKQLIYDIYRQAEFFDTIQLQYGDVDKYADIMLNNQGLRFRDIATILEKPGVTELITYTQMNQTVLSLPGGCNHVLKRDLSNGLVLLTSLKYYSGISKLMQTYPPDDGLYTHQYFQNIFRRYEALFDQYLETHQEQFDLIVFFGAQTQYGQDDDGAFDSFNNLIPSYMNFCKKFINISTTGTDGDLSGVGYLEKVKAAVEQIDKQNPKVLVVRGTHGQRDGGATFTNGSRLQKGFFDDLREYVNQIHGSIELSSCFAAYKGEYGGIGAASVLSSGFSPSGSLFDSLMLRAQGIKSMKLRQVPENNKFSLFFQNKDLNDFAISRPDLRDVLGDSKLNLQDFDLLLSNMSFVQMMRLQKEIAFEISGSRVSFENFDSLLDAWNDIKQHSEITYNADFDRNGTVSYGEAQLYRFIHFEENLTHIGFSDGKEQLFLSSTESNAATDKSQMT